jgi:hypothetical protein
VNAIRQLDREAVSLGADAIALVGNISDKASPASSYAPILKALAESHLPAFYVPGPEDAPFADFLREAANLEIVYPHLRGVHATFAMAPGYVVFSGMGGAIHDDPATVRDEVEGLRYPGWEAEYRLKFLHELKDYQKVFMFATVPEHKGLGQKGSSSLTEIINTYIPRIVLVAGEPRSREIIGKSLVIMLGSVSEGNFTIVELRKHEVTDGHMDLLPGEDQPQQQKVA